MKKEDISRLLQRYLSAKEEGKEPYFDADQIEELLDSFEDSDDYTYYDEVLALGLKLHPGNTELQIRLCQQYVYNEDYDSALTLIDNIAETDSQDLDILRLECYGARGQYDKVIKYTEKLVASQCDYLETIFEYVVPFLTDLGMHKEAREYVDRGLKMFPDNYALKDELCYILEAEGDLQTAIRICNELIDKNPYSYDHWYTMGRLCSMTGDYDKAIDAFDFALTCDDFDNEIYLLKAYCLYMNESYEKALEVYAEVIDDEGLVSRIKPLMAECYIKLGRYEEGYRILKEQLEDDSKEKEVFIYINLIRCCKELEREEEALEILYQAAAAYPDNIRILSLLAMSYIENGREEMAFDTLDRLFDLLETKEIYENDEDSESLIHAGQFLYFKGNPEKALKFYQKALKLNPSNTIIHLHIAMAYLAQEKFEKCMKHFGMIDPGAFIKYLKRSGVNTDHLFELPGPFPEKHIPPEDLVKEYLKNKDNSN